MKQFLLFVVCIVAVFSLGAFVAGNKPNAEKSIRTGADQVEKYLPCLKANALQ
jgi:hypothetical protein